MVSGSRTKIRRDRLALPPGRVAVRVRSGRRGLGRRGRVWREQAVALAYVLPALLGLALFAYYPIVKGVIVSFQYVDFVHTPRWVGWQNFSYVWGDPQFARAWVNTFAFAGIGLVLSYLAPVLIAMLLNESGRGRWFFQLAVYLPVMLPPIVTALLWGYLFDPTRAGLLNALLGLVGVGPQGWIDSPSQALVCLAVIGAWGGFGFWTLVYLAALQGLPGELYEAAELDGAGIVPLVRYVTVPHIRNVMLAGLLLGFIGGMQVFTIPLALTQGGPQNATVTVVLLIYQYAFNINDYGAAAALGLMLMIFLGIFSGFYQWLARRLSTV